MESEVEKVEAQYNPGDTSLVVSGCARLPGLGPPGVVDFRGFGLALSGVIG